MTTTATAEGPPTARLGPRSDMGSLAAASLASLGAGAIHAAAIGVHSEHRQAVVAFAAVAVGQLAFGAAGLVRGSRRVAALGAVVNVAALGGWLLAKTVGIGFVDGMGEAEGVQLADGLAAALAGIAVILAVPVLLRPNRARGSAGVGSSVLAGLAALVLVVSMTGMVSAGSHAHADDGHGDGHDEEAAGGQAHDAGADEAAGHGDGHAATAAVPPKTYDPTKPIDLSGVPGVSLTQQARAENLIAITLDRLPQFADYRDAERVGFHSIGDGGTGHEHFVNWDYINDDKILNPDYPESLVYEVDPATGSRTLVSAMFMLKRGASLDAVPDVGGELTQWHVHDDLCFTDDPVAPRVAGITKVGGACAPPLIKFDPTPMIHVWITQHPCGPFAALEGVGAGQVKAGETHKCNHAHGG